MKPSIAIPERTTADSAISVIPDTVFPVNYQVVADDQDINDGSAGINLESVEQESSSEHLNTGHNWFPNSIDSRVDYASFDACNYNLASNVPSENIKGPIVFPSVIEELLEGTDQEKRQLKEVFELKGHDRLDENAASSEYYSATDGQQSILVSFSSRCVLNGTVCERSRLHRIKFYGCFDKPLGRFLQDDLFDQVTSSGFIVLVFVCLSAWLSMGIVMN